MFAAEFWTASSYRDSAQTVGTLSRQLVARRSCPRCDPSWPAFEFRSGLVRSDEKKPVNAESFIGLLKREAEHARHVVVGDEARSEGMP